MDITARWGGFVIVLIRVFSAWPRHYVRDPPGQHPSRRWSTI
jgi:hypothetical protein